MHWYVSTNLGLCIRLVSVYYSDIQLNYAGMLLWSLSGFLSNSLAFSTDMGADKRTKGFRVYISMMYILGGCLSTTTVFQSSCGARGPGRPALKRYIRGRQSRNLKLLASNLSHALSCLEEQGG